MKTYKAVFILFICSIIVGCGDYSNADRNSSRQLHYTELMNRLGEPTQVHGDGTGGKIMSWSPIPIDEGDLHRGSHNLSHDVYRVNSQGYVYDRR